MHPGFRSILVALDFSDSSARVLEYAGLLAERFGASLRLLHVVEDPMVAAAWSEAYAFDATELRDRLKADAEAQIASAAALVASVPVTTEVVIGSPAKTIVQKTGEPGTDLVVLGTHGRGGFTHFVVGSVAERVVRGAACPVLTVRAPAATAGVPVRSTTATALA